MSNIEEYATLNEHGILVDCGNNLPELISWEQLINNTIEFCNSQLSDENEIELIAARLTKVAETLMQHSLKKH